MTDVVAAIIQRDERILICQRPANKARGLLWEFAGGKTEEGETHAEALKRECREELGVEIKVKKLRRTECYRYPDTEVRIFFYEAELAGGEPRAIEHAAIRWIYPSQAQYFDFCPADEPLIKELAERSGAAKKNRKLGKKGEKKATKFLKRSGYKILKRNYVTPFGEVDIVAKRGDVLVFCEVKTRLSDKFGAPSEAVTPSKQKSYTRAAQYFVKDDGVTVRFDVAEISDGELNYIENAFPARYA